MPDLPPYRNAEQVALDAIADLFPANGVGTSTPADLEKRASFARVRRIGGGDIDPFTDTARLAVDVFATSYAVGTAKAEQVRQRLLTAPSPFDRITTLTAPVEAPWADSSPVRRWTATYSTALRRSTAA